MDGHRGNIGNDFLNRTPPTGQLTYYELLESARVLGQMARTIRREPADTPAKKINALRKAGKASSPIESPIIATSTAIPIAEHIALPVKKVAFALPYTSSKTSASAALFNGANVKPIANPYKTNPGNILPQ